jgi:hypothetical protein
MMLGGCASTQISDSAYTLQPKARDTAGNQFKRDLMACKHVTMQRHVVKDPQHEALLVDCMVQDKDYVPIPVGKHFRDK